jgi:hypothetical protein
MTTNLAYTPWRLLVVGTESWTRSLRRELLARVPGLDVTTTLPAALSSYLVEAGFYRVLCVPPVAWQRLSKAKRRRYASQVGLVVLAPETASPEELSNAVAGVYLPSAVTAEAAIQALQDLFASLSQGVRLSQSASAPLAWVGEDTAWPPMTSEAPAPAEPAGAGAVPATAGPAAGVSIGMLVVEKGHVFTGNPTVHSAGGDQVNIGTAPEGQGQRVQAGGDQVNIFSSAGTIPSLSVRTAGDQVNLGLAQPDRNAVCPRCQQRAVAGHKFCEACGQALV